MDTLFLSWANPFSLLLCLENSYPLTYEDSKSIIPFMKIPLPFLHRNAHIPSYVSLLRVIIIIYHS